jgi:hypothetical protein
MTKNKMVLTGTEIQLEECAATNKKGTTVGRSKRLEIVKPAETAITE